MFILLVSKFVHIYLSIYLWHYVAGPLSRRSLCLLWRKTKQRPDLEISTRPEVGKGTPVRELAKEDPEALWPVDTGQQKRPVGMR